MGTVFRKLKTWYDQHVADIREPEIRLVDSIFHHHKIKTYGADLRNRDLPLEERATAALYVGLLAYTGGVNSATLASQYIHDMIDILIMPNTSTKVRISVLKGLSSICYINPQNQNIAKDRHLAEIILTYLQEEEDTPDDSNLVLVKFWVCYLMTVVSCNNMSYIKLFQELGGQALEKSLEHLSNMEWFGWPQNYATLMCVLMGYSYMEADK